MTSEEVLTLRLALCANGYTPLPLFGKEPPIYGKNNKHKGLKNWQLLDNVTREQIETWGNSWPGAINTGILTRITPTLDLDILDEAAAAAVEKLVRERFEERGYILVRVGLPPKRAILFRTLDPFDKITVNFIETRGKVEKIEFLCNGQQIVAHGIHPDTGKPYSWFGATPWEIPHDDLPCINEEEAQQLVNEVTELLCSDFSYAREQTKAKTPRSGNGAHPVSKNYAITALEHECAAVVGAKLGTRNEQINRSAFNLGQLVEDGLLDENEVRERLYNAAVACGYVADDGAQAALDTINSGLRGGRAHPRQAAQPQPTPPPSRSSPAPPPQPAASQPIPGGPQGGTTIDDVLKVFQHWLVMSDWTPVYAALGTVAANLLPGDPVWLGLVAPPSSAKTEILNSLSKLPNVMPAATLTPAALLSGTPHKQQTHGARDGLLRQIGSFGFLVLKDFGSILSMRPEAKAEVLAALREIYDGHWTRHVGADGGKTLHWSGKIGLLFGCTDVINSHHSVITSMGDRFLLSRFTPCKGQFKQAIKHTGGTTAQMRNELAEAVASLFAIPLPPPQHISQDDILYIDEIVSLVVSLRGTVERDHYRRELQNIYGEEGTGRIGLTLERLLTGLGTLGMASPVAMPVIRAVALDSVPPLRRRAYEHLQDLNGATASTTDVAKILRLPTATTRRVLEELVIFHLAERIPQGQGKSRCLEKSLIARA